MHSSSSSIGVGVAIVGNICISCALNLQKHVHNMLTSIEHAPLYYQVPLWWIGLLLMILGEAGNFIAYGFAPAVLVSPLGTVALITNSLIAPIFLAERFRMLDFVGILLAVVGTILMMAVATQTETPQLTPDSLWHSLLQTQFLVYFAVSIVCCLILFRYSKSEWSKQFVLIDLSLVALFGGYTVLATKAVSSLLNLTIFQIFSLPIFYCMLFVLVVTAVLQVRFLNKALSNFTSTQVIPTNFVLFTISTIVGSAILYNDFNSMTMESSCLAITGIVLDLIGVWLITSTESMEVRALPEAALTPLLPSTPIIRPKSRTQGSSSYHHASFLQPYIRAQSHSLQGSFIDFEEGLGPHRVLDFNLDH